MQLTCGVTGTRTAVLVALVLYVPFLHACSRRPSDQTRSPECWEHNDQRDTAFLDLFACPLEGVQSPGAVRVFVGIRNSSQHPLLVDARFDLFGSLDVSIRDTEGQILRPRTWWEPGDVQPHAEPYFQWVMPRGGIIGRVVNLSCDFEDLEPFDENATCHPLYHFQEGVYTAEFRFGPIRVCSGIRCAEGGEWEATLTAKPANITVGDSQQQR